MSGILTCIAYRRISRYCLEKFSTHHASVVRFVWCLCVARFRKLAQTPAYPDALGDFVFAQRTCCNSFSVYHRMRHLSEVCTVVGSSRGIFRVSMQAYSRKQNKNISVELEPSGIELGGVACVDSNCDQISDFT